MQTVSEVFENIDNRILTPLILALVFFLSSSSSSFLDIRPAWRVIESRSFDAQDREIYFLWRWISARLVLRYPTREYKSSTRLCLVSIEWESSFFLILIFFLFLYLSVLIFHLVSSLSILPAISSCHSNCSRWIHPLALNKVLLDVPLNRNRTISACHHHTDSHFYREFLIPR